ncbi:IQ domain-containing protein IQM5 [Cryptomeria japonica]|uniref:IQ domain-containing protein IQM5 n=1 Tax=Cryptomeria japonica TaxID=3369 RepID=UPI0025AB6C6B|nr:IQ domain-containing protein IQM5 [Cryptomeria japonica]XP_057849412.1 IQ domain-containing protein IQM5 [Cryptomeria japonica]
MGVPLFLREESQTLLAGAGGKHVSDTCTEKLAELAALGSISFKAKRLRRMTARSTSFNGRDLEINASGSMSFKGRKRETDLRRSSSFKCKNIETASEDCINFKDEELPIPTQGTISPRASYSESASSSSISSKKMSLESSPLGSDSYKEEAAALKLQKVYKSYRTRRSLADCAVYIEELWWQAIDFAIDFVTLERNTVSFFDIGKPETAVSRWSRASIKAAKVGKGLSKDEKARKLALQHWLEAIDPRHRYGHNLHFYYDAWFKNDTAQPFFYWLDVGDGRDLNLERCSRAKLQQQCIKYLGPKEREHYEVIVEDGKFVYKYSGHLVDTSKGSKGSKWIFVLSTLRKLYVGQKKKGTFQHSSFLAGGATSAAGRLIVHEGILKSIWPYSGHYLPTEENFKEFINFLEENSIDHTNVQKDPPNEDEMSVDAEENLITGSEPNSEAERDEQHLVEKFGKLDSQKEFKCASTLVKESEAFWPSFRRIETDEICTRFTPDGFKDSNDKMFSNDSDENMLLQEGIVLEKRDSSAQEAHKSAGCQDNQEVCYKRSLSDKNLVDTRTEVPQKSLLQRLHSKKSLQSYQLGKQLSLKWSTGAGPRIGCVADYPSELRVMALEKVHLSPRYRSTNSPREFLDSPRKSTSPKNSS